MRKSALAYTVAIGATLVAILLRWLADPFLGDHLPLVTLYGGVAVAVWFGGLRPGILAMLLGYLSCHYLFISPRHTLRLNTVRDLIGIIAFFFTAAFIVAMGEAVRVGQRRFEELSQLKELISDNPQQELHLSELKSLAERRMAVLERGIALARQDNRAAAASLVRSDTGKRLMDDARSAVGVRPQLMDRAEWAAN